MAQRRFFMVKQVWEFLKTEGRWIYAPLFILVVLLGMLTVFAHSSAFAPLIYTLF